MVIEGSYPLDAPLFGFHGVSVSMHMKQSEGRLATSRSGIETHSREGMDLSHQTLGQQPVEHTINWVSFAWSNRWLLLLGVAIGLGGGYFQFIQSPAMYRTAARVQIIEPSSANLTVREIDRITSSRSIIDESLVMRSERILKRASEIGELSTTPEFSGMPPEVIAAMIGGAALSIAPPEKSQSNSVLEVQYSCTSPATCQRVVQAIIDAYGMHLQDQYRNVGQETLDLIQTARNDVLNKLNGLESEFSQFKQDSGLIFRDGATTSIHRDNADKYLGQKQTLLIEKGRLLSKLEATRLAIAAKQPIEAVLIALQLDGEAGSIAKPTNEKISRLKEANDQSTISERMRREQLLPLQMEKQDLMSTVGADHPAMKTLDQRVRAMQTTIDEIARAEEDFRRQLEAAWAQEEGEAGQTLEPAEVLENRVRIGVLALRQQLESVSQEEKLIDESYRAEMENAKSESVAEMRSAQYFREIDRQQQLYNRIMERLDEVNLMSDSTGLKLFPLDTAKLGYQFAPSLSKSLLMGSFLGCILAGGLAFLREISDRSYHSASDIAEHVGLPVIGHVPVLSNKRVEMEGDEAGLFAKIDARLCTVFGGKGSKAEAFRAIRTAIYFSNQSGNNQILQVTSSTPGEGKSTIVANLAVAIAQSGRSVLLIDADLRRPRVHKLFGIESDKGLAWAIEQVAASSRPSDLLFAEAILETPVPNLSVMVAGIRPENPAELLSSSSFETLLDFLRGKFDMILIDSPPMLAVSDPSNIVRRADGVVMVVRLRKNVKPLVAQSTRMLETLEAKVLGVVVNGVGGSEARGYGKDSSRDGYYNYGQYYKYGYGYSYGTTTNGKYSEYYDEGRPSKNRKQSKPVAFIEAKPTVTNRVS